MRRLINIHICCRPAVDLEGMDLSWNSSQWISLHRDVSPAHSNNSPTHSDDSDVDLLPQLDGLTDNKSIVMSFTYTFYLLLLLFIFDNEM